MKKLLGLVVLCGLYVAGAYYTGVQGEKNIRHQFELAEAQSKAQGVNLVLNSYTRGVFSSEMNFTATYSNLAVPGFPLVLSSTTKVQHGPVLYSSNIGFGLFSSVSTLEVSLADDNVNATLKALFGESVGQVVTQGHFNNTYTSAWQLPQVNFAKDGNAFTMDESVVSVTGSYSAIDAAGSINLGAGVWTFADGSALNISPVVGNFDVTNISELVNISNMDMTIDSIKFTNNSPMGFSVDQLKIIQTQKMVNNKIDTAVRFSANKVNGPIEITDIRYDIDVNQIDPKALTKWAEVAQTAQSADPEQMLSLYAEHLTELMEVILQEGLQFKLGLGANFMGGTSAADFTIDYKPLPNNQQLGDITDPKDYLLLAEADLLIKVSESIVSQTPLGGMIAPYMDTHVTRDGDLFVLHGSLKGGKIMVGNTQFPAEMLLGLLPVGDDGSTVDDNAAW